MINDIKVLNIKCFRTSFHKIYVRVCLFSGYVQPVKCKDKTVKQSHYYCDGGLVCNFPIHCFDGKCSCTTALTIISTVLVTNPSSKLKETQSYNFMHNKHKRIVYVASTRNSCRLLQDGICQQSQKTLSFISWVQKKIQVLVNSTQRLSDFFW